MVSSRVVTSSPPDVPIADMEQRGRFGARLFVMRVQVAMENEKERQLVWVASQVAWVPCVAVGGGEEFTFFMLVLKCGLNSAAQKDI